MWRLKQRDEPPNKSLEMTLAIVCFSSNLFSFLNADRAPLKASVLLGLVLMITKEQVMPLLLEACPSFSDKWEEHRAFYNDDDILYVDLGEFAHHLVELQRAQCIEEFPAVFEVIERLHLEGNPYVKEAATIGALEGIQNVAGNTGVDPDVFVQYLLPESEKWWRQLNDFWNGKIPSVGATIDEA